jgi:hypothetical protein
MPQRPPSSVNPVSKNAGGPGHPAIGAGIHPPSPGVLATAARAGTQGAPSVGSAEPQCRSASDCPALLFGNRTAPGAPAGSSHCSGCSTPASNGRAHKSQRAVRRRIAQTTALKTKRRSLLNVSWVGIVSTVREGPSPHGSLGRNRIDSCGLDPMIERTSRRRFGPLASGSLSGLSCESTAY